MNRIKSFTSRRDTWLVAAAAMLLSIAYTWYYFLHNDILAYGDAESHINIAKRVVSGVTPGFGQLGGNWLPLHHLLMIPFVWNNWMWRTGLGGSIVSMGAFVIATVFLYRLVRELTTNKIAALVAVAVFAFNPNVAYMQSTPLSELPLIATVVASTFYLVRWAATDNLLLLMLSAVWSLAGTLVRYDAWFSVIMEMAIVLIIGLSRRWKWSKIEGSLLIFGVPALLGIALWLGWNELIFHDPLYFMDSAYSAHAQQQAFMERGQLFTYHHLWLSVKSYFDAVIDVAGLWAVLTGAAALVWNFLRLRRRGTINLSASLMLAPIPFNILSLVAGISILFVPEAVPAGFQYPLFNVRYGLMAVPGLAMLIGMFYAQLAPYARRLFAVITPIEILLFATLATPITLADGLIGLSARMPGSSPNPVNIYIANHYTGGYIAFDDFSRVANPISLNVPMNKIIYVGNHPDWEDVESNPASLATWLIIRHDSTDALWSQLKNNPELAADYTGVYNNGKTFVYHRDDNLALAATN